MAHGELRALRAHRVAEHDGEEGGEEGKGGRRELVFDRFLVPVNTRATRWHSKLIF